ncbi:MAG: alpha/beta hydrolase [Myxococcales bacterium]|nr:alpha/beta hydrolase [Myxococcales bacterium]MDP3501928.1 alpha/beta hydrolase [Myxococcales bacterium]
MALLAAGLLVPTLFRVDRASRLWLLGLTFFGSAWAPGLAVLGALAALGGVWSDAPVPVVLGSVAGAIGAHTTWAVTRSTDAAFAQAFGSQWRRRLPPHAERPMLQQRWDWGVPRAPRVLLEKDVVFGTAGPNGRPLRCDIWRPPEGTAPTGLAVVYLHGGAWYLMDKDLGTRRFFRHLCALGHVVIDVGYRPCPQADIVGMVHDVRRAVAWVKARSASWGVSKERVVLMGGSAGGHLALLAAYGTRDEVLTPPELRVEDPSVLGVVSYYGIVDLLAYDAFARRFQPEEGGGELPPRPPPDAFTERVFESIVGWRLDPELLPPLPPHWAMMRQLIASGRVPTDAEWQRASPLHLVHEGCPPTLHFQPQFDHLQPVESGRALKEHLTKLGVPCVYVEYARTLHAFDLLVPPLVSPAAQSALFDVERFLSLLAKGPPVS